MDSTLNPVFLFLDLDVNIDGKLSQTRTQYHSHGIKTQARRPLDKNSSLEAWKVSQGRLLAAFTPIPNCNSLIVVITSYDPGRIANIGRQLPQSFWSLLPG